METYWDWLPSFRWGLEAQEVDTPTSSLFSADTLIDGLSSIVVWAAAFMWRLMLWAVRASLSTDLVDGAAWRVDRAAAVSSGVLLSSVLGVAAVGGMVYLVFRFVKKGERTGIVKQAAVSLICLGVLVGMLTASVSSDQQREQWEVEHEAWQLEAAEAETNGSAIPPEPAPPSPSGLSPGWWMEKTIGLVTAAGTSIGQALSFGDIDDGIAFLASEDSDTSPLDCEYYIGELNRRSEHVAEVGGDVENFGSAYIARAMSDLWLNASYQTFASSQFGTSGYSPQVYCRYLESGSRQSGTQQLQTTVDTAAGPECDMRYEQNEETGTWVWVWDTPSGRISECGEPTDIWLGNRAEDILVGRPVLLEGRFSSGNATYRTGLEYAASDIADCSEAGLGNVWSDLPSASASAAACGRLALFVQNMTLGSYDWTDTRDDGGGKSNGDQEFGWMSAALAACGATDNIISDIISRGGGDGFTSWGEIDDPSKAAARFRDFELRQCLAAMAAALGTADSRQQLGSVSISDVDMLLVCSPTFCPLAHADIVDYLEDTDTLADITPSRLRALREVLGTDRQILESMDNTIRNADSDTLGGLFPEGSPAGRNLSDPEIENSTVQDLLESVRAAFHSFNMGHNNWVELPRLFIALTLSGVIPPAELFREQALNNSGQSDVEEFFLTYMTDTLTSRIWQIAFGSLNAYQPTVVTGETAEQLSFGNTDDIDFRLSELLDPSYDLDSGELPDPVYRPTAFGQLFRPPVNYSHGVRLANFWVLCVPEVPDPGEEPTAEEYERWRETQDLTGLYWSVRSDFSDIKPLEVSRVDSSSAFANETSGTLEQTFEQEWGHVCGAVWSGATAKAGVRSYFCNSGFFDGVCNTFNQLLNRIGSGRREFVANDITDVRPLGAGVFELGTEQVIFPTGAQFSDGTTFRGENVTTVSENAELWLGEANSRSGPGGARLTSAMVALMVTFAMFVLMGAIVLMVLGAQIALLVGFALIPLVLFLGVIPSERTRKILRGFFSLIGFSLIGKTFAALALSVVVLAVWILNVMAFSLFGGIGFRWAYLLATVMSCVVILYAGRKMWQALKHVTQETGVSQISAKPLGWGRRNLRRGLYRGRRGLYRGRRRLGLGRSGAPPGLPLGRRTRVTRDSASPDGSSSAAAGAGKSAGGKTPQSNTSGSSSRTGGSRTATASQGNPPPQPSQDIPPEEPPTDQPPPSTAPKPRNRSRWPEPGR